MNNLWKEYIFSQKLAQVTLLVYSNKVEIMSWMDWTLIFAYEIFLLVKLVRLDTRGVKTSKGIRL